MNINQIYDDLGIPPNLREHMLRVTTIIKFLEKNWAKNLSTHVNWSKTIIAGLLHDVGNMVRFDFDKLPIYPIDYWKEKQKQTINKYGDDDHIATERILTEKNIDPEIIQIILNKNFVNATKIANSSNWNEKILLYADMRVSPHGITTLKERLDDVISRIPKYRDNPNTPNLVNSGYEIEKQIQNNINNSIELITNDIYESFPKEELLKIEV